MEAILKANGFDSFTTKDLMLADGSWLVQWADYPPRRMAEIRRHLEAHSLVHAFWDNGYVAAVSAHLQANQYLGWQKLRMMVNS